MNAKIHQQLANRKSRIERRLDKKRLGNIDRPVFTAANIHYEFSDRVHGSAHGGIGAIHLLARRVGLIDAIDQKLHLLTIHSPYHESDHVLNLAYNALCDGTCLQDIELRRQDEAYLDALGARRIPDPTTAGDFCRRFSAADVPTLIDAINDVRPGVWARQPAAFFDLARIDMDGTLVETDAECKQGIDIAYDGTWGYHPLVVSLANTARHQEEKQTILGMEFKTFLNAFLRMPCQIVQSGRRLIYRLLSWNPWQRTFFRTFAQLRC